MNTEDETIKDENYDIRTIFIDEDPTNYGAFVEILHEEDKEESFTEPEYAKVVELITAMDDSTPPTSHFELSTIEELLTAQLNNTFCT